MASLIQRTHNRWLDNHPGTIAAWEQNHTHNFPTWVKQVHPDTFTTADPALIPTGYLKDIYPHLWQWGPRGEIYTTQLDRIETLLDGIANGSAYNDFLDAVDATANGHLEAIYINNAIMGDLINHAATHGLPLPGDDILYGIDPAPLPQGERHTIDYLTGHIIWSEFRDDAAPFQNFIYNFSLLSVHHTFFTTHARHNTLIRDSLNAYNTFCDTWGIQR